MLMREAESAIEGQPHHNSASLSGLTSAHQRLSQCACAGITGSIAAAMCCALIEGQGSGTRSAQEHMSKAVAQRDIAWRRHPPMPPSLYSCSLRATCVLCPTPASWEDHRRHSCAGCHALPVSCPWRQQRAVGAFSKIVLHATTTT